MRQNPNTRRSRGRNNRKPGNSRNQIFDSNGPGARVRGNSAQIYEKYQQLARDASSSGDRVAAEGFYQHAEHYYRLMDAAGLNRDGTQQEQNPQQNPQQNQPQNQPQNGNVAANGATVEVVQAPAEQEAVASSEAATAPTEPAVEVISESPEQTPPATTNGSDGSEEEAKPARRTRNRRPNGSANGRNKPVQVAEADASDEGSEPPSEDTEPASA